MTEQELIAEDRRNGDGTHRLLMALYGRDDVSTVGKLLGGSDAKMLHDAADEILRGRTRFRAIMRLRNWKARK
jgi:hypothetical protein